MAGNDLRAEAAMRLLYDLLALQSGSRDRGMGRYAFNLLRGLQRVRPQWRIELIVHSYPPPSAARPAAAEILGNSPLQVFEPPIRCVPDTRDVVDRYYSDWLAAQEADWVFHPSLFETDGAVPQYGRSRPRVAGVLYDLIPLRFPDDYLRGLIDPLAYATRFRTACGLDLLLAISRSTADDARQLMGPDAPRIVNIRGAADPRLGGAVTPEQAPAVLAKFGLTRPFILYVGGSDPRKNMAGAVAAFAALPTSLRVSHDLVLACWLPDEARHELGEFAAKLGVRDSVRLTGFVSDEELVTLYRTCRVFFFPSLYEGLGLPPLEAMHFGAPVVTSNCSAMPEYGGPLSWYCDPRSPDSMASALTRALSEPRERHEAERRRFAATFHWDDVAERTAVALEQANPRPGCDVPPLRVAWVGGEDSGQVRDLASSLASRFELEWVRRPTPRAQPETGMAGRLLVLAPEEVALRHEARPFDLFVHHLRGNEAEEQLLWLATAYPGLVVIHDEAGSKAPPLSEPIARVLHDAVAVLVESGARYQEVRRLTHAPVVAVRDSVTTRLDWYSTVIEMAAQLAREADLPWLIEVQNALAGLREEDSAHLMEPWARLRSQRIRRGS